MMDIDECMERVKIRLGHDSAVYSDALIEDVITTAQSAIMNRRFPFGYSDSEPFPNRYVDLAVRVSLDLLNRIGAEGETQHTENGITRLYEKSWISESLLREVTPMCGVVFR